MPSKLWLTFYGFGILNDIGTNLIEMLYFFPIPIKNLFRSVLEISFKAF